MNSMNPGGEESDYLNAVYEIFNYGGRGPRTVEKKEKRLRFTHRALETLCPDFEKIRVAHIAGTSGKGSTALFLHSILFREKRTGLVISPHILDFNERIQIDGRPVSHPEITRHWNGLRPGLMKFERESGETALFQDIVLLLAFRLFMEYEVEWAVVETGLGGRFDQTSALNPSLTIITKIGLDHTHILGRTIPEIALEKAGIIRTGVGVYTTEREGEAFEVIRRAAEERGAPLKVVEPHKIRFLEGCTGMEFTLGNERYRIPVVGVHQAKNAALAASASNSLEGITLPDIKKGLESARLPGRIEFRGRLIIDTGHNPLELRALFSTLEHCLSPGKWVVVCGFADTKDHRGMLREVLKFADAVVLTKAEYRGAEPERLFEIARTIPGAEKKEIFVERRAAEAVEKGRSISLMEEGRGFLVVTGSTFLIDEVFNPHPLLRALNSEKWRKKEIANGQ